MPSSESQEPQDTQGHRRRQPAMPPTESQVSQTLSLAPATTPGASTPPALLQDTGMAYFSPPLIQPSFSTNFPTIGTDLTQPTPILPAPVPSVVTHDPHQPTPPVLNSIMFPIGHHVDQLTKQKIISGQFVNLSVLLVRDPTNAQPTSTLTIDPQGNIVTQPKQPSKIRSIDRWTDAFLIYCSIYTTVHPHRMQQLLKYMHDIRLGAQKSNGWATYDQQFRLRMAHNPSQDWGRVDSELWLLYMTPTFDNPAPSTNAMTSTLRASAPECIALILTVV